jgi:hypothetical protein
MTIDKWLDEQHEELGEDIKKWERWIETGVRPRHPQKRSNQSNKPSKRTKNKLG